MGNIKLNTQLNKKLTSLESRTTNLEHYQTKQQDINKLITQRLGNMEQNQLVFIGIINDLKTELKEFKHEMREFKSEMREFKTEMKEFRQEIREDNRYIKKAVGLLMELSESSERKHEKTNRRLLAFENRDNYLKSLRE